MAEKDSLYLLGAEVLNTIKSLLKEVNKYKLETSDYQETHNLIFVSLLVVFSYNFFGNINNGSSVFKQLVTITSKVWVLSSCSSAKTLCNLFFVALRRFHPTKRPVAPGNLHGYVCQFADRKAVGQLFQEYAQPEEIVPPRQINRPPKHPWFVIPSDHDHRRIADDIWEFA